MIKVLVLVIIIATVIEVENRKHKVLKHRHKHALRESRPERDAGGIQLKPEATRNKLFPGYGTNFRYIGEVKNGLDRVTVVTSIPIPKFSDLHRRLLKFSNCTIDFKLPGARQEGHPQYEVNRWCAKAMAQVKHYQSQQQELQYLLRQLLNHDLYSVLPELNQTPSMYNLELYTSNGTHSVRDKRAIGSLFLKAVPGLITLAVESIGSYLKKRQHRKINIAIREMRKKENIIIGTLKQYRDEFLMYGKFNLKSIKGIIDSINALHARQTIYETMVQKREFNQRNSTLSAIKYSFDLQMFLRNAREEHIEAYKDAVKAARDFLDGVAILVQGRLPRSLFSDNQIREILQEVETIIKRNYPDYVLAATHVSHYRDMKSVTFAVDQETHSLIVTFPAFVKSFNQPPFSMYEAETVPVPIVDKNVQANSYSRVRIEKRYIAAGTDYYIQLRISELLMCKNVRYIYYCEELFVIKHKSQHSCVSAIFYNLGPAAVTNHCKFDYMYNATVPPVILDGGRDVLLANFHGPRSLKCSSVNGGLAKPAPELSYAVVNREFLCDCRLEMEHASVLRQLSSCSPSSSSKMEVKFVINLAFWQMFKKRSPASASNILPQYTGGEQTFSVNLYQSPNKVMGQPAELQSFMNTMGSDGNKIPSEEEKEAEQPLQLVMPRWLNNVLEMVCTALTTVSMCAILMIIAHHFKLKNWVASIAMAVMPPPSECVNLSAVAMASSLVAPDPAIGTKVICSYPVAVVWQNILGYLILIYAITQYFRPITWVRGYKYSKNCALYLFVYDTDHERYSPVKIMSLKGHVHHYKMKYSSGGLIMTLEKSCTFDTLKLDWNGVLLLEKNEPLKLPVSVTVALKHKIKTRRIMSQLGEVQFMLKQGSSWHDITDYYKVKRKAVKHKAETVALEVVQSPKMKRGKSPKSKRKPIDPETKPVAV